MTEHPITFNAEMIEAILAGRKTQTRRPVEPQPISLARSTAGTARWELVDGDWGVRWSADYPASWAIGHRCPYGQPSDILKVRLATDGREMPMNTENGRLRLRVTAVRVERLQEIDEDDAIKEGVDEVSIADVPRQATWSRRDDFAQLWDFFYADRGLGWKQDPWVWVLEFEGCEP